MDLINDLKITDNLIYINLLISENKKWDKYKNDFNVLKKEIIKLNCIFNKLTNEKNKKALKKNLIKMVKKFKILIERKIKKYYSDFELFKIKFNLKKNNIIELNNLIDNNIENNSILKIETIDDINTPLYWAKTNNLLQVSIKLFLNLNPFENKDKEIISLITDIYKNYRILPYHNFSHAFSVMQILNFFFLKSNNLNLILNEKFKYYSLLAGISHDLRHNGTNNNYQIKINNSISNISFEDSVLEKMHSYVFLKLLNKKRNNFLEDKKDYNEAKDIIICSIIHTDMSKHNLLINNFEEFKNINDFKNYNDKKVF